METKFSIMCNIERHINNFYKNIQNAKTVIGQED